MRSVTTVRCFSRLNSSLYCIRLATETGTTGTFPTLYAMIDWVPKFPGQAVRIFLLKGKSPLFKEMTVIVEEGMRIDTTTGVVLGRHLEPDSYSVDASPLFIYNRSVRFGILCTKLMYNYDEVAAVMAMFTKLEELWNDTKQRYLPRKYFLSQKLVCLELCRHYSFKCSINTAIHDKKRERAQLMIFNDLFAIIKKREWQLECTLANKPNNTNSVRVQNYPSPGAKLPVTPSEMFVRLMTLAHQWPSNSG